MSLRQFAGQGNNLKDSISSRLGQSLDFTCTSTTSVEPIPVASNTPMLAAARVQRYPLASRIAIERCSFLDPLRLAFTLNSC
jgi:hypothetical protein